MRLGAARLLLSRCVIVAEHTRAHRIPRTTSLVSHFTRRQYCSFHHADPFDANRDDDMAQELPERKKGEKKVKNKAPAVQLELDPPPAYLQHRIEIFERVKAKRNAEIAAKPRNEINITLGDGRTQVGKAWETSPADVARAISKSLFERTVIARVDGELWDLERPLEGNCSLELLDFEHPEGKKVFWHSSAHVLGEAAERRFGCDLCMGPPIQDGFFYEMALPEGGVVQADDYTPLESIADKAIKEKQPFERLEMTRDELLDMFKTNKYKQYYIKDRVPDGGSTTVYRCGPLIDLCRGPHVPHTGRIKTFKVMKNSASYFLGDATNDSLQRVYGVSFPDKKQMDEHLKRLEEAAKRDHRKIGREQDLFFFHEMSPGCCFFLPHGTIIYNALQAFLREEYWKRGYQEVLSPNMFNSELWKQSGHWQHYKDDMFTFDVEKDKWALKPMNCPGHALIFGHRERSYRELPIRMAEFGILHRNEASGALSGLTRVRRFAQDDTHIFCTEAQVEQEILGLFDFLRVVYGNFGFTFRLLLSTRPEKFLGDINTWDRAEAQLEKALDEFASQGNVKWELNAGDGAFYGPKIDVMISDALGREFQCATIQLDFQLPQQFNLEYMTANAADAKTEGDAAPAPAAAAQVAAPQTNGTSEASHTRSGSKSSSSGTHARTGSKSSASQPSGHARTPSKPESSAHARTSSKSQSGTHARTPSKSDAKSPTAAAAPAPAAVVAAAATDSKTTQPEKSFRRDVTPGCARPVMIHRAIMGSFERFIAILTEHFGGKWPFWLSPRQVLIVPVMVGAHDYVLEVQQACRAAGLHADVDISGNTLKKKILTGQMQQYNFIFVVGAQEQESRSVNIRARDDRASQERGEIVALDEAITMMQKLRDDRVNSVPTL